jgi:RNA polymerase sigma-70 factor (ECF subfamily)
MEVADGHERDSSRSVKVRYPSVNHEGLRCVERKSVQEAVPGKLDPTVAAAQEGDSVAFESLVRENVDAVYGHALRFFADAGTAEDVTQEVFLKVYRSIGGFDGRSSFRTWLYRLTRNVCLDTFRAGRRRPVPMDPVQMPEISRGDIADDVIVAETLERAVATLQPEDRDAFNAVTLFGLSYEEASGSLGVPVGTVKSRVFRARRTLVGLLDLAGRGSA